MAMYVLRKLIRPRSRRNEYQTSLIFLIISILPAIFLGTVIGGSLEGAYGEHISQILGLGSIGVPIGIAIGLMLTMSLVMVLIASLGYFIACIFYKLHEKTI